MKKAAGCRGLPVPAAFLYSEGGFFMQYAKPVRVAIIGCGLISGVYFENITKRFSILELAGCCDLNEALASAAAKNMEFPF